MPSHTTALTYRVDGMSCAHCKSAVTETVGRVSGVHVVDVDLETKIVRVAGENIDDRAVVEAIDDAGYDATAA